ncbi:transcriptional regulator [Deefgea rivuli]|uniref:transcriptional regulator n=1 Tax=Deefgea rivuli TaxID=400948 RepID=UPI000480EEAC|nr:transcriptional regulator [Deefgea rivuli]
MSSNDKIAFSVRLKQALERSSRTVETGTQLAIQFNLRYLGESISQQTAHKWLNAQSIPTDDKIRVLANWLDVPFQWLRNGDSEERLIRLEPLNNPVMLSDEEIRHIQKLRVLPEYQRVLIEKLLTEFALMKTGNSDR